MENISMLNPSRWKFTLDEFPELTFWADNVLLPNVNLQEVIIPFRGNKMNRSGDTIDFGPMDIDFKVNEDLNPYLEMLTWMYEIANPIELNHDLVQSSVGLLFLLTNKNRPNKAFKMVGCRPTALAPLRFSQTEENTEITSTITFAIDYFLPIDT